MRLGLSLVAGGRLLIAVASLVVEHRLRAEGLQQLQLPGSREWAQELRCMGLVALQHMRSSHTKDRTQVSCIGRCIHYH